ncbi:MAG: glycosyltransferase family 2 protein [Acidobacteria bacterium]|nr:glycosyltransferase family 2 protein [Acidobacteriota bacterium]
MAGIQSSVEAARDKGDAPTTAAAAAGRVCVVVVTYNRKELLRECLRALLEQSRPVEQILVVNNASTDGTEDTLAREFSPKEFPLIRVMHLPKNVGGAGGFQQGMRRAYEEGFDWVWVMDDDTIAEPDSLAELFAARERFEEGRRPCVMASKVVWTDGSLHYMNPSWVKLSDLENLYASIQRSTMSIRSTTFVSMLLHRDVINRYGLPIADYFIWGDDTEYTARVLRHEFGVLVPASRVVHKTAKNYTALDAAPQKYYYHVRNAIWMLTRSDAWSGKERVRHTVGLLRSIWIYLSLSRFSWPSLRGVGSGLRDGLMRHPVR